MGKPYKIDWDNYCAICEYETKKGNKKVSRFLMFTDTAGVKIFTRGGVVFLTEQNSEVL